MARSNRDDDGLSTLTYAPRRGVTPGASAFVLTVEVGPDAGASFRIAAADAGRVYLGTGATAAVKVTDRTVSRRHAGIDVSERGLRITDPGSTNGTFVNGVAVLEAYLRGGEVLQVGETTLRVERAESPSPLGAREPVTTFGALVGASDAMRGLYPLCLRIAASTIPVLIEGETGTGKEVLAESLHEMGPRSGGPFVVFDCTAVAPSLIESELFGHERGAFTGATTTRKGVFEQAHTGTLLVDEIGDLPSALQPKLLRALERSEVKRVGGTAPIRVDVRILSATRRDLDREVEAGRFRDDLFHRLAVARIELPALRDRRGDVSLLARHFAAAMQIARVDHDTLTRWESYRWPGNVRELRNAVMRWAALGDATPTARASTPASASHSQNDIEAILAEGIPFAAARQRVVDAFEQRYIEGVLEKHGGNVRQAALASGIGRRYFQRIKARTA